MAIGALLGGALAGATTGAIFGGFAPFPNSIMIPFMGAQSAVLAYNFGIYYELGKRTVKSLDNDFFNKIRANSADEITVIDNGQEIKMKYNQYISYLTKRNSQQMITDFRNIIPDFQSLQNDIIEQTVVIEIKKAARTPSAAAEIIGTLLTASDKELNQQYEHWNDQIQKWHKETFGNFEHGTDSESEADKRRGGDPANQPELGKDDIPIIKEEDKEPEPSPTDKTPEPSIPAPYAPESSQLRMRVEIYDHMSNGIVRWSYIWHDWNYRQWQVVIGEWNKLMIYLHNTGNPLHKSAAITMNINVGTAQVAIFKHYGKKA